MTEKRDENTEKRAKRNNRNEQKEVTATEQRWQKQIRLTEQKLTEVDTPSKKPADKIDMKIVDRITIAIYTMNRTKQGS